MSRSRSAPTSVARRIVLTLVATATFGAIIACSPPTTTTTPVVPPDINLMTDSQVQSVLGTMADKVVAGYADPKLQAAIPADQRANVQHLLDQLKTDSGRASLVTQLRAASAGISRVVPPRRAGFDLGTLGQSAGSQKVIPNVVPVQPTRVAPPSGAGTGTGASVPVAAAPSAQCNAPDGVGTVAPPTGVASGGLLTPQHDVFTRTSSGIAVGSDGNLSAAGLEPIAGQGPGVQFRTHGFAQQVLVRINLDDPKQFGPGALYPLIDIKPIGGTAAQEYRAAISDGHIYCYQGDTNAKRGYFEGWVSIPRSEPGFQLTDEVVENDWYMSFVQHDFSLSQPGPQYWAGADRATIHAGAAPLTTTALLPHAVGAFASMTPDPGDGSQNVLTDTNGNVSDDIEAPVRQLIDSKLRSSAHDALQGDLLPWYVDFVASGLWADLSQPLETTIDLKAAHAQDGTGNNNIPYAPTGALQATIHTFAKADLTSVILGMPCFGMSANVTVDANANAWAESAGVGTGLTPRVVQSITSDVDVDMPLVDWTQLGCVIARGLVAAGVGEHYVNKGINDGLNDAFSSDGSITKLLQGFELQSYLPTIDLGNAHIAPVIGNLDNSWCGATGAPAGCSKDQDLIGTGGVGVAADATLVSTLGEAFGGNLAGRFRNVFTPTTYSSIDDLTTGHRDRNQRVSGLGVVIDPRLVNLALRDLAQGSATTRTTNGLLDQSQALGSGFAVTTRPEVAPEVLGVPKPPIVACDGNCGPGPYPAPPSQATVPVALPDTRIALTTGPGAPINFSLAMSVNAGAGFDPSTGKLKATLDSPQIDVMVTGGCQVDYTKAYATSYTFCGRGTGGNGGKGTTGAPISLTDLLGYVANNIVLPSLSDSIGGISLPSLDGIVPGLHVSLTNVHSEDRGGFVAVYGDLRPTPSLAIVPSYHNVDLNTQASGDHVVFAATGNNINQTLPGTTYAWVITDGSNNQALTTTAVNGTNGGFVEVPAESFLPTTDVNGQPVKKAHAKLTLSQPGLQVTSEIDFSWTLQTGPPPNPCATGVVHLKALAAVNNGGGAPGC